MTSGPDTLSLYIHVPFCRGKCRYCDFYSLPRGGELTDRYTAALARELDLVLCAASPCPFSLASVYVGGGTPSLLTADQWHRLARTVTERFSRHENLEWTIECNPESFTKEKAHAWRESGVNRLSVGVQSLQDRELRFLGRAHSADLAHGLLASPAMNLFPSVGVDMIYGLPGQTVADVENLVAALLASPCVTHLSAYELALADSTPLGRHRRLLPLPDNDAVADMYLAVHEVAAARGMEHYEVSNYALPGHRSRHNGRYWSHEPFLGLGASAHSWIPPVRRANVADLERYLLDIESGRAPVAFEETPNREELACEALFLGLRMAEGVEEGRFLALTGAPLRSPERDPVLAELCSEGLLVHERSRWLPTLKGMLAADGMARALMGEAQRVMERVDRPAGPA